MQQVAFISKFLTLAWYFAGNGKMNMNKISMKKIREIN